MGSEINPLVLFEGESVEGWGGHRAKADELRFPYPDRAGTKTGLFVGGFSAARHEVSACRARRMLTALPHAIYLDEVTGLMVEGRELIAPCRLRLFA